MRVPLTAPDLAALRALDDDALRAKLAEFSAAVLAERTRGSEATLGALQKRESDAWVYYSVDWPLSMDARRSWLIAASELRDWRDVARLYRSRIAEERETTEKDVTEADLRKIELRIEGAIENIARVNYEAGSAGNGIHVRADVEAVMEDVAELANRYHDKLAAVEEKVARLSARVSPAVAPDVASEIEAQALEPVRCGACGELPSRHTAEMGVCPGSGPDESATQYVPRDLTCLCGTALVRNGATVKAHWTGSICADCEQVLFARANGVAPDVSEEFTNLVDLFAAAVEERVMAECDPSYVAYGRYAEKTEVEKKVRARLLAAGPVPQPATRRPNHLNENDS